MDASGSLDEEARQGPERSVRSSAHHSEVIPHDLSPANSIRKTSIKYCSTSWLSQEHETGQLRHGTIVKRLRYCISPRPWRSQCIVLSINAHQAVSLPTTCATYRAFVVTSLQVMTNMTFEYLKGLPPTTTYHCYSMARAASKLIASVTCCQHLRWGTPQLFSTVLSSEHHRRIRGELRASGHLRTTLHRMIRSLICSIPSGRAQNDAGRMARRPGVMASAAWGCICGTGAEHGF